MERSQQLSSIWRPYAEAARNTGLRLTGSILGPGKSGGRLDDLVRRLHKELDRMIQQAFDSLPGGDVACGPGCDYCCRTLRVTAIPVEVFAIVHRLRGSHDLDPAFEARLAAATDGPPAVASGLATTPEAAEALSRAPATPCPLLSDGMCLVYTSRPLACRGCASADASLCAACDDERPVPRSTAHQLGAAAMAAGVTAALESLGLAGEPVGLRSGLALALCTEDAEKRWLRGEDVFSGCAMPRTGA